MTIMRRKNIFLAVLLLCGSMLMAQTPANRTATTIVADVLAQMPAKNQVEFDKLMQDLGTTGEEGVLMLVGRINAPGKGSNALVEYALSGLTSFVSAKGQEQVCKVVEQAYLKGLSASTERETQAFIIRQLQLIGSDASVSALAGKLSDESLGVPAASALGAIGTPAAQEALVKALGTQTPSVVLKTVVRAVAETGASQAESALQALAGSSDSDIKAEAFYALSKVGSARSLPLLKSAANAARYTLEKTGANEAYIMLIKRVLSLGQAETAQKAALQLQKDAAKAGSLQSREAALEILLAADRQLTGGRNVVKMVETALKDPNRDYRNAALWYASEGATGELYTKLVKDLPKAKPEWKVDVLNWLGNEALDADKNGLIKNIQVSLDVSGKQVLLTQLQSSDFAVKEAAAWALQKIGDSSVINNLAALLRSDNAQEVALGKQTLNAFSGNITDAVTRVIPQAGEAGKVAGIELLAARKANLGLGTVTQQTKSDNPAVRKAAYVALKDVVESQNFTNMCGMLEEADKAYVPDMQQAVIATIAGMSAAEQTQAVTQRMNQSAGKSHLYYAVLANTGDDKALETIKNNLNSGNTEIREAAFNALLAWKDQRAVEELYHICQTASSDAVFQQALNRYVALASDAALTGENRLLLLRKAMEIAKTDEQRNTILKRIEATDTFLALLYAGQYLDNQALQQTAASAVMNIAIGHPEFNGANVRSLLNKVSQVLNNPDADYQRQNIRKFLEDNPAEEGFVSLFNGRDLTGWKGLVQDPIKRQKMTPAQLQREQVKADEIMRQNWTVEDGCITYVGSGFDNLCTDKQYGDFEMYVDWMLDPAGPEADAGIYLRGAPQVQIWDTARVNVGAQVGSGGLYNNKKHRDTPLKVADNKLGEWNSFYIKMVGDRVTVRLNGELVVDDVILENYWDRSQPIFPVEQLELQAHGSKVYFRDIYVKELQRQEPFTLSAEEQREGFKVLFDGTNMYEFTGNLVDYTLKDGCIEVNPETSFGGNLYTVNEYSNFIFRFDFQLTPGANNGIGIRTPMEGDAAYVGMEIQILDCEHEIYKNITPLQHHGSVYGIIPAREDHPSAFRPVGEWNTEEIVADGDHIRVTVNGQVILDGNIREATVNGTADHKEHPGLFNKTGHIGFLGHGSPLKFRNIRIKELK